MADGDESPGDERPGDEESPVDRGPKDAVLDDLDPDDIDVTLIEDEERAAARRLSSIEAGRRRAGAAGAAMAGAMLALSEIYEGRTRDDEIVAVAEHPGEPGDIDRDGIALRVGDVDVWAPPPGATEGDAPATSPVSEPERRRPGAPGSDGASGSA